MRLIHCQKIIQGTVKAVRLLLCVLLMAHAGQAQPHSVTIAIPQRLPTPLDALYANLDTADSYRTKIDSLVDNAVYNDYKFSSDGFTFKNHYTNILSNTIKDFDTIVNNLSTMKDSMTIEITDYRNSLSAYILSCKRICGKDSTTGEQNLRSYEDTRFRLLFAKSALLRVANLLQVVFNEHSIETNEHITDSLILARNTYREVLSGIYINNSLFGIGYSCFLPKRNNREVAIGGDLLIQGNSLYNGLNNKPTYAGVGGNLHVGLAHRGFLFLAGPSVLDIARPATNGFARTTTVSWNAGIQYHYQALGIGLLYSPLYASGIKLSYWIK